MCIAPSWKMPISPTTPVDRFLLVMALYMRLFLPSARMALIKATAAKSGCLAGGIL